MDGQIATPEKERWPPWAKGFLKALATCGVIGHAAKRVKINRQDAYRLRDLDEDFREAWQVALDTALDAAEKEAWRRATKGCRRKVYYKGVPVGMEREYSDTLLIFMLKAHRPQKYRDRVTLDANVSGTMTHDVAFDPTAEAERIAAALAARRSGRGTHGGDGIAKPVDTP